MYSSMSCSPVTATLHTSRGWDQGQNAACSTMHYSTRVGRRRGKLYGKGQGLGSARMRRIKRCTACMRQPGTMHHSPRQ
jgi:hypothetical protein